MTVNFYDSVDDALLKFAVIVSRYEGKRVFCKHRARDTYEVPGGHREKGESILEAAKRELYEETGATDFTLVPVCVYSVIGKNRVNAGGDEAYGMLYYADIRALGELPPSEIERVVFFEDLPKKWTYPSIQPKLIARAEEAVNRSGGRRS